ncbi:MAG: maleylpyruvate isomerase N-terminal domain-containing protein [Actinomycetota bacterium]|nr:maleylpyruvate isomerase N-terminal domain-containing protein [Actinomycetota bacterium]
MNAVERDVSGATAAHAQLLHGLAGLTDAQVAAPSLLPGWTVGHVLAHLARNADSHTGMLLAANRGEVGAQYPGGAQQRASDIDAGAGRPATEHLADLTDANSRLEAAWAAMTPPGWQGTGSTFAGSVPVGDLPFRRWRETLLHHADLGFAYDWSDWPAEYVRLELGRMTMQWASRKPMGLTALPAAALALPEHERLAWLVGRAAPAGLEPAGIF